MRPISRLLLVALLGAITGAALADTPPAPASAPATASKPAPAAKSLDLSAPPLNHVLSSAQIQILVAEHDEDQIQSIDVESDRVSDPVPQGQLRALPWALMHPLQAWKVFTPITD
jgi:hypothetical protein